MAGVPAPAKWWGRVPWRHVLTRSVLIVGGAGSVGSRVVGILAQRSDLHVIIGARSLDAAAQSVAASFDADIRVIDLNAPSSWDVALAGVDLVIVCMDQEDPGFARKVLSSGIHYVDVTADDSFFKSVEALPEAEVRATALLSVGLAPGITNLLAANAASALDSVDRIDIGLLLGLGDAHGEAAMRWTLRNIFSARAAEPRMIDFGQHWGAASHPLDGFRRPTRAAANDAGHADGDANGLRFTLDDGTLVRSRLPVSRQ